MIQRNYTTVLLILTHLFLAGMVYSPAKAQKRIAGSFELRYFSNDEKANGITDFHGETEVFNTPERLEFLKEYAGYACNFFGDTGLNTKVVSSDEVKNFLENLKPQPLPDIRTRIPLGRWKWLGAKENPCNSRNASGWEWMKTKDLAIENEALVFKQAKSTIEHPFPTQDWRMYIELDLDLSTALVGKEFSYCLHNDGDQVIEVGAKSNGVFYYTVGENTVEYCSVAKLRKYKLKLEIDFVEGAYNLLVNDSLVADFVALSSSKRKVNAVKLKGDAGINMDNLLMIGYNLIDNPRRPYKAEIICDEDFSNHVDLNGWIQPGYDDGKWADTDLPKVHGGYRNAGENLFLRKKVHINNFERAVLNIEALDPGGKIWINGEIVAIIKNRYPVKLEVGRYLKKDAENIICIQVDTSKVLNPMGHSPSDAYVGWFAGRAYLDLTKKTFIEDIFAYSGGSSSMTHRLQIMNKPVQDFKGNITIKYYPWFPEEIETASAIETHPVEITGTTMLEVEVPVMIKKPVTWSSESPYLYKVVAELSDDKGNVIDDYVFTTGIRTVSQEGGTFRVNGKPSMLNGAQIMGYRLPMTNLALWNRCPPVGLLAEELLMIRKMNGNLMRIHVHAETTLPDGINDPRIAEMADQLGIMLIWQTPSWIRDGEWSGIDFYGYPKYMEQVYNHPSIVMWELSNHPRAKKAWAVSFYNRFFEKAYNTVYTMDPSRLISATSHLRTCIYGDDLGKIDKDGNKIEAAREYTAPMVTRGNQDSYTGYGKKWSYLRESPNPYTESFLNSPDRAYFNFEHEESIGQPNWSLAKGKPWYKMQSYEWDYDQKSIGKKLDASEWRESQAWQAFSAWESMKKQRILGYDGFSWCCLHGGANMVTYKKPLIDALGHAKLAFYSNKMIFQHTVAGSGDVDVVYGPGDKITPVIMHLGNKKQVTLRVIIKNKEGKIVDEKVVKDIALPEGREAIKLGGFKPAIKSPGYYFIDYLLEE